ncbi:retropepsin-like aspartic protease [Telluribacter sp. SYSU D00476]|uniref:retropepsin-like aspartic protease n=1 Tax=Telluribacter sp. SYSU D00476 TaxID=2811430 RepID=UPI001FF15B3B|nr:retropepsin-like aspartic protease [Telluribacter sp. SYSU D00476]
MHKRKAVRSGYVTQKGFVREIPFEMYVSNKLIIEAKLNGSSRTYRFIVDSGALSVLSKNVAEELGLIKPGKKALPAHIVLDKVEIAGLAFNKVGTMVFDLEKDPFLSKCAQVDGMIGTSVLKHFIWHFDFRNQKILVSETPDSLPSAASEISLPFTTDEYNRARVNCTFPNGKTKKFIFDTGGNGFMTNDIALFEDLRSQVQYKANSGQANYGGLRAPVYDNTSYTARITNFKVGHLPVDTVEVQFIPRTANHVGWHFLHNYTVTFDWNKRKVGLIPYAQQLPLGSPSSFGFTLFYKVDTPTNEKRMIVAAVDKDSPADKAGLKAGDRVIQVGNKDYRVLTDECVVFEGVEIEGNEAQLTILRDDQPQVVTVKLAAVDK